MIDTLDYEVQLNEIINKLELLSHTMLSEASDLKENGDIKGWHLSYRGHAIESLIDLLGLIYKA